MSDDRRTVHPLPWVIDKAFHTLWRVIDDDGNVVFAGRPDLAQDFFESPAMKQRIGALEAVCQSLRDHAGSVTPKMLIDRLEPLGFTYPRQERPC